jgi:cellulose synthase/poly-beta-1,6-N-acetylglucosamine synthase-like glycosyltransferase
VAATTCSIIVFVDANTRLSPGCLRAMVRHFNDPSVGAVAGEKRVADPMRAQNAYWRFESWLKQAESATGSTIGLVGELSAVRRSCFRPVPVDVAVDDLWIALDVVASGHRIVYEPDAYALEDASSDLRIEWERRTRIVAGALDVLWRRRRMLVPGASPVTGQVWGHRLIRISAGPLAHLALVVMSLLRMRDSRLAQLFIVGHLWAATALRATASGRELPAAAALPGQLLFLQLVGLGGVFRYVRGDRPAVWHKPDRQR